ncbi:MAG: tetratricopeptide repeat protein [Bacteroidales bacterium]
MNIFEEQSVKDLEIIANEYPWFQLGVIKYLKKIKSEAPEKFDAESNKFADFVFDKALLKKIFSEKDSPTKLSLNSVETYNIETELKQKIAKSEDKANLRSLVQSINAAKAPKEEVLAPPKKDIQGKNTSTEPERPEPSKLSPENIKDENQPATIGKDANLTHNTPEKDSKNTPNGYSNDDHSFEAIKARLEAETSNSSDTNELATDKNTECVGKIETSKDINIDEVSENTLSKVEQDESVQDKETLEMPEGTLFAETLADLFKKQGKYENAIKIYEELKIKFPDSINVFERKIMELQKQI